MSNIDAARGDKLRHPSLVNFSRMGHCAPTVMKTLLDAAHVDAEWLIKLTAGLPGGIGNTGGECGGVTAPLVLLGLRAAEPEHRRLPTVVRQGQALMRHFTEQQGTIRCREIRGDARVPLRCVRVVQQAPEVYASALEEESIDLLPTEQEQAQGVLCAHWLTRDFHCAHAVFRGMSDARFASDALRAASSAFVGGTAMSGGTCSALTAGVMSLGLALGTIEDSRPRVLRMIVTMALDGDAFANSLNAFNEVMNLGHDLATWFRSEFGSTCCRELTGCNLGCKADVERYMERDGTRQCCAMAEAVARRAESMIRERRAMAATHSIDAEAH